MIPNLSSVSITVSFGQYKDGRILLARIAGVLSPGSLGSPDCRFIRQELGRAILAMEPEAVLMDLADMEYQYGNALVDAFQVLDGYPVAFLLSEKNKVGLKSLMGSGDNVFLDAEKAREHVIDAWERL